MKKSQVKNKPLYKKKERLIISLSLFFIMGLMCSLYPEYVDLGYILYQMKQEKIRQNKEYYLKRTKLRREIIFRKRRDQFLRMGQRHGSLKTVKRL